jgi:hypothetical protein
MKFKSRIFALLMLVTSLGLLAACEASDKQADEATISDSSAAVHNKPQHDTDRSPGKPGPPIRIKYSIVGKPVVGQPVEIDVQVSSSVAVQSLRVSYQVMDEATLFFPDTQAREMIYTNIADDDVREQRVTVVPQGEGRSYLNVLVEVDTEFGLFTKTAAIPVQVGTVLAKPKLNGTLQTDEQGEAVISMPAQEE